MFFDVRAAKQLQSGQHLTIDGCPGLRLEASATRKTWTYRYKSHAGLMKQVAIGQYPTMPVQDAASAWKNLRDLRDAGTDPREWRKAQRQTAKPTPGSYAVRALVQDYITGHIESSRKADGAAAARRALERLMDEEPAFADSPAAAVTRSMCFDLLDDRKATPTATAKLRALMGSAWEYALDAGRLDGDVPNWWRAVMKGRLKSKGKVIGGEHRGQQRRILHLFELTELLRWLPNMHELGRDVTVMYLWTCTRGAEITGMRPEHISDEPDGWWWTVPKEATKNERFADAVDLRVPLIGRALEVVKRRMESVGESGWLFEDVRGEQYTQHDFSTYIYGLQPYSKKVARREGEGLVLTVTHWTPHDLRRTGRTLLAELGCPREIGEAILGHLPPAIEGTYNLHTYDKERRLWLGKLSKRLHSIQAGTPARP
jgi:integrase